MTIYEKAVAYINSYDYDTKASLGGMHDTIVYISTDFGDLRLHDEEIIVFAGNYDRVLA